MNSAIRSRWLAINFAATIFVSAFLLFQVQPMVSKFILPWFGGTPAVWTTCMLFFQTLLFAGYAYAHFSATWLRPSQQAVLHLVLIVAALLLLQVVPADSWKPTDSLNPVGKILGILAAYVGLPFFVLSSTGPLLQSWFARSFPGRTPYRLYALSNFGSLLALLSYPLYFERVFAIGGQKVFWSWGFVIYAAFCGYAAMRLWLDWQREGSGFGVQGSGRGQTVEAGGQSTAAASQQVGVVQSEVAGELVKSPPENQIGPISVWWRAILWLLLPAFASIVLLATTNHVCIDICVMPLLWVVPLALYLLTFIIAFDSPRWYRPLLMSAFAMVTIYLVMIIFYSGDQESLNIEKAGWPAEGLFKAATRLGEMQKLDESKMPDRSDFSIGFVTYAGLNFAAMFGICLLCHGQLVRLRPDPKHLTAYYMLIALGGALGGIFVTLIAPQLFIGNLEWNLSFEVGYWLGMVVAFGVLLYRLYAGNPWFQKMIEPARALFTAAPPRQNNEITVVFSWWAAALAALVVVFAAIGERRLMVCMQEKAESDQNSANKIRFQVRNFFGTLTVKDHYEKDSDDNPEDRDDKQPVYRLLSHGRITHGLQFIDKDLRHLPTTYYAPASGVGVTVGYYHRQHEKGVQIGAVGLGTGTMAAYVQEGDAIRFYDINPDVIKITTSGKWFTYLKDAVTRGGTTDVVLGDARLSLEREAKTASRGYHVLVLDAFSGDAIPIHLLTVEAVEIYLKHLATPEHGGEHGALAVHITNRYVDLEPIVLALAEHFKLGHAFIANHNGPDEMFSSDWIILSYNKDLIDELNENQRAVHKGEDEPTKRLLWTDAYSNLIDVLK